MKGILNFPFKIGASIMKILAAIIDAILKMICAIFGVKPPAVLREMPELSVKADDVKSELENALKCGRSSINSYSRNIGHTVHQYAKAKSADRITMDLSALNDAQQEWLLMLSDDDLAKLANVGVSKCEKAANGTKCGIYGLPNPYVKQTEKLKLRKQENVESYEYNLAFA